MLGRSAVARLGAALVAVVLAFAPGSPTIPPAHAAAVSGPSGAAVVSAADPCTQFDCYAVAITLTGGGSGRVQSTDAQFVPDGIMDCPMVRGVVNTSLCSHKYPDTTGAGSVVVYLKITPEPGSELCDEAGCTVVPRKVSKMFTTSGTIFESFNVLVLDIRLAKAGSGSGRITSDPSYLDCGTSCETSLEYGAVLTLIADPDPGSKFSKWTGFCAGQGARCKFTLTKDVTTSATFTAITVATAEPSAEPSPSPSKEPVATASPAPTDAPPTIAPTVAAPTPGPTLDPGPSNTESGSGPIIILLAILLVGLLGGLGVVLVRGLQKAPPTA